MARSRSKSGSSRITKTASRWKRLGYTKERSLRKAFSVTYPNPFRRKSRREA